MSTLVTRERTIRFTEHRIRRAGARCFGENEAIPKVGAALRVPKDSPLIEVGLEGSGPSGRRSREGAAGQRNRARAYPARGPRGRLDPGCTMTTTHLGEEAAMREQSAGAAGRPVRTVLSLVTVCALVVGAWVLGSSPPAGAGEPPAVPGAPTGVSALPEPGGASVDWSPPATDGGARITQYKIVATDLTDHAHGGQKAATKGYVGQTIRGLTSGDRYTFTVAATNSAGTGPASTRSNAVVPTSPPPPRGIGCEHVSGTTSGLVTLSSCRAAGGSLVGTGTMPGAILKGSGHGTISWRVGKTLSSTTISVKTTLGPDPTTGWCARKGLGRQYHVAGKVTANTEPNVAVGQTVNGYICISAAGGVKQTHYGEFGI